MAIYIEDNESEMVNDDSYYNDDLVPDHYWNGLFNLLEKSNTLDEPDINYPDID